MTIDKYGLNNVFFLCIHPIHHAYNADDTAHSKLVVDNDEQDYHEFDSLNDLYEDEEQDNHLEEVKEQNDESLGEEVFVMENEE